MDIHDILHPGDQMEVTIWKDLQNDADEEGSTFITLVERVEKSCCLVLPGDVHFEEMKALVKPPMVVGALCSQPSSLVVFYPTLTAVEVISHKGFWLTFTPDMELQAIQRREFVRVQTRRKIKVDMSPDEEHEDLWKLEGWSIDLSGGGIQFASSHEFEKDQILNLEIPVSADVKMLQLKAKVVICRLNPFTNKQNEQYATACQFVDIQEKHRTLLVGECFRLQLEQKRRANL